MSIDEDMVDSFIKNSHQIKVLRGKKYGALEADKDAICTSPSYTYPTPKFNLLNCSTELNSHSYFCFYLPSRTSFVTVTF